MRGMRGRGQAASVLLATAKVLVLLGSDGALAYNNGLGRLPPMVWHAACRVLRS